MSDLFSRSKPRHLSLASPVSSTQSSKDDSSESYMHSNIYMHRNTLTDVYNSVNTRLPKLDSINMNLDETLRTVRTMKNVVDVSGREERRDET